MEQLAQTLAEMRQQLGEAQRLAKEAQRAGVRTMAAMANLEPAMEGASTGLAEKPFAEFTPEMKLSSKQLYCLLVNTVRRKALTLVRGAEKHHSIAAWKRIKTECQPDAAAWHTAMLMGTMQSGWDSRGAANTFFASHAPESIRHAVRLAAGPVGGKYRVVRHYMSEILQFVRIFDKDARGVESEPSSASATPMDVDVIGKGKGKGCFVCGHPSHAAKDCKLNQGKGKGHSKGKNTTDKNSPANFEGECRHCGTKAHKWADCW